MRPTRLIASLVLLLAVAAGACVPAPTLVAPAAIPDKLAEILARGTLVISTDPVYPPQSEQDITAVRLADTRCAANQSTANQFHGFDVDVAVELARRLGVEPCFVTPQWDLVTAGGWGDRWDINIGSMSITKERAEGLYFAQPYNAGSASFFIHRDNQTTHAPSDLDGKRVGVCGGCYTEFYLEGSLDMPGPPVQFKVKGAQIQAYEHDADAMRDLAKGDGIILDAILADTDEVREAIEEGLPLKPLGEPVQFIYIAPAIDKRSSKDPVSFIRKVSEIIQGMHADGTLSAYSERYYVFDYTLAASKFDLQTLKQYP